MFYGYGILNNHVPTLKATAMRGGSASPFLTSLYAVYKAESNANDSLSTYNGTAVGGVTYTAGKSGNAFTFNGTTGYVSLPNNMFNSFTGDFSISFWYNPSVLSGTKDILSSFTYYLLNYYGFEISVVSSTYGIYIYNGTLSSVTLQSGTGTAVIGSWTHVVITRKASTGTKIYINGTLNVSNTSTTNAVYAPTNTNCLGASIFSGSATNYANGTLDEVNTWTKELTSTEVTELYNAGTGKFYPY